MRWGSVKGAGEDTSGLVDCPRGSFIGSVANGYVFQASMKIRENTISFKIMLTLNMAQQPLEVEG